MRTNGITTLGRVLELLDFSTDPPTWRVDRQCQVRAGDVAGWIDGAYRRIEIDGRAYLAHRLAWLVANGEWPAADIDHRDGRGLNNGGENLRDVTRTVNSQNRRAANKNSGCGFLGVSRNGKGWAGRIWVPPKLIHLGTFDTPQQAHSAYVEAKRRLHPGCTI